MQIYVVLYIIANRKSVIPKLSAREFKKYI